MSQSCTYTFKGPDGRKMTIEGASSLKAYLATGGLEFLLGEVRADLARRPEQVLASQGREGDWSRLPGTHATKAAAEATVKVKVNGAKGTKPNPAWREYEFRIGQGSDDQWYIDARKRPGAASMKMSDKISYEGVTRSANRQTDTPEFKAWFGDSKVVDENGKPLVMYHGTFDDFSTFERTGDLGFHFGTAKAANDRLKQEGKKAKNKVRDPQVMPVYVRIENPADMPDLITWSAPSLAKELLERGYITEDQARPVLDSTLSQEGAKDPAAVFHQHLVRALETNGYDGIRYRNLIEGTTRGIGNRSLDEFVEAVPNPAFGKGSDSAFLARFKDTKYPVGGATGATEQEVMDAARKVLARRSNGFDYSYIAFRPTQIKSAIGNRGTFSLDDSDITRSSGRDVKPLSVEQDPKEWAVDGEPTITLNNARFGGGSVVQWVDGDRENYITSIAAYGDVRGHEMLRWLKEHTGKPSFAVDAVDDAIGFYERMGDLGLVSGYTQDMVESFFGIDFGDGEPRRYAGDVRFNRDNARRSAERFTDDQREELERAGRDADEAIRSAPRDYSVDLAAQQEAEKPAKAWIEKVYAGLPRNPMMPRQRVMMFGEDDFAVLELDASGLNPGGVTINWIQAYPLRSGNGTKAIRELQRMAAEDGIELDLWPWDKGRVSQANLIKFYKSVGFEPIKRGSKNMIWRPESVSRSVDRNPRDNPSFVRWFGDSVMTENGRPGGVPLVLYHGGFDFANAPAGRAVPKTGNRGALGVGFYLTPDEGRAGEYAEENRGAVTQAYVRMLRPLEIRITAGQDPMIEALVSLGMDREKAARKVETAYEKYGYVGSEVKGLALNEGYDGLVEYIDGRMSEVVAWAPTQIKSATDNDGGYSWNPDIRRSAERSPLGFYSALAKGIEGLPTKQAPAGAWRAAIKGLVNKGQVKADEVEWSGVNDWLDLQQGKVTKEQVSEYLKQGGVRVEEVVLGGPDLNETLDQRVARFNQALSDTEWVAVAGEDNDIYFTNEDGDSRDFDSLPTAVRRRLPREDVRARTDDLTKYSKYTLPGGENYREVLLTLPERDAIDEHRSFLARIRFKYPGTIAERNAAMSSEERAQLEALAARAQAQRDAPIYRSSHWDQPNVLAHIRLNDRTDADGKRVLFVEELQSDWGQEGKKKGFARDTTGWRVQQREDSDDPSQVEILDSNGRVVWQGTANGTDSQTIAMAAKEATVPTAPFVTKTEGWLNLALKRVMIMAAEGGYDKVALVNGEQSAERFSLDKQIDSVSWRPAGADRATITISPKSGAAMIGIVDTNTGVFPRFESGVFGGESLESVLGKEIAERVLASPEGSLAGDGLKVEAKGMRAFYDTIVPTALKKLLPKVSGEGMTTVSIAAGDDRLSVDSFMGGKHVIKSAKSGLYFAGTAGWVTLDNRPATFNDEASARSRMIELQRDIDTSASAQPGFDVTEAMREKVSEGLPLFSRDRASWTDDRIDGLLRTHAYTMDDGRSKAYAGFVSPEDFLRATTPADSVESLEAEKRPLDEKELAGEVQPIFLKGEPQDDGTWKTTGHEGRHRMMALRDAGVRRVPVVFDVGYGLTREPLQGLYVTPQRWSGAGQAQGGFFVDNLIPISYKHANDLRDVFGGEGAVRFSPDRAQTETPEFKRWFGNSQIRDESGDPLVVYHATPGDFAEFKPGGADPTLSGPAMWFTDSKEYQPAAHNIGRRKGTFADGTNVMPVYLKMERPLVIDDKGMLDWSREVFAGGSNEFPHLMPKKWVDEVRRDGDYDGIIFDGPALGWKNAVREYIVFEPTQIKSAIGNSGAFDPANPDITKSEDREDRATSAWQSPSASKFDDWVYKLQDKQVDTKRVVDEIKDVAGALADDLDVYLQEELFHGRAAKRTEDFVNKELRPLVDSMAKDGLKIEDLDTFLHARHAREANAVIAQRNPEIQDGGSGMTNQDAADYFANLDEAQRRKLETAAAKVDAILAETRKMMVDYQLESPDVIKGWGQMFQHYVPLMREDEGAGAGAGIGQGFSIKGREVKSRTGSTRKVVDIFANIAMQRELTIVRGEKNRVSQALHGLATANPNKEFWTVDKVPTTPTFNPATGLVEDRPDNLFKMRDNVIVSKVLEQDDEGRTVVREKAVIFDEKKKNERAVRMATALKNLDAAQLEGLMGASAAVTRYFASINTQYNPVFGIINLMRDVQGAIVNLNTTELKDDKLKVARGTMSALMGIMADARKARRGEAGTSEWSALWEDFQSVGGQTGYRQLFQTSADRAKDIQRALNPDAWMDSKWGRIFTANGTLKVPLSVAMKGARWLFDLLSDYNLAMENGIRLSAYKVALDKGMSRERAASLAKNLTVNFNRKGQVGQQAGALYAFFNAAMQGTARLGQTLFEMEPGKPKTIRLSSLGKKIVYGGMLLGTTQALALAAAGFSDDDPPDFVRERSLIIPTGGKTYISIPMPLGLHVIPNVGRVTTEWALSGFKNTPQRVASLLGTFADSFNPIGNAGWSMQTLAPTALDPLVALTENKDWQGRPIAKESMNRDMPGPQLYRDTATSWSKLISESINYLSGGDKYSRGVLSPTPDQIDYLVGQLTGGVGREISKVEQTVMGLVRGEEVPTYKVPLVGRLIGDSGSQASEGTAFYANAQKLNKLETEIKLLREDGKTAEAQALRASRPEAYLMTQANYAERAVQRLRKEKSELIKDGAPREKIREIEEKITARMAGLNRAMEALEAAR